MIQALVCDALQEVASASLFLGNLYERLRDKRQRALATESGRIAREELRKKKLPPPGGLRPWVYLPEVDGERYAWKQALSGLLFLNMLAVLGTASGTQSAHGRMCQEWDAALQAAVIGFRTAFDQLLIQEDLQGALNSALDRIESVSRAAWKDLPPEHRIGPNCEPLENWLRRFWSERIGAQLLNS